MLAAALCALIPLPLYFAQSFPSAYWPVTLSFHLSISLLLCHFALQPLRHSLSSASKARRGAPTGLTVEDATRWERKEAADLFHSPFPALFLCRHCLLLLPCCVHPSRSRLLPFSDSIQTGKRVLALTQVGHLFKCPTELYKDAAASNVYLYIWRSAHATLSLFCFFPLSDTTTSLSVSLSMVHGWWQNMTLNV